MRELQEGYRVTETITTERRTYTLDEERAEELAYMGPRYDARTGATYAYTIEPCPHDSAGGRDEPLTSTGLVRRTVWTCDDCGAVYRETVGHWTYTRASKSWARMHPPDGMYLVECTDGCPWNDANDLAHI
jgi:hypothetical protein